MAARKRRGQFPKPTKERNQWKVRYRIYITQPDGTVKPVPKTKCLGSVEVVTYAEARMAVAKLLTPVNKAQPGIEYRGKTLDSLIAKWRKAVKPTFRLSTQAQYEWAIRNYIVPAFGPAPLDVIDKSDVQEFVTAAATKLSGESVRDLLARFRGILSIGHDWGWIDVNPASGRLRMPPRIPVRRKVILTPGQFHILIAGLGKPYDVIVMLAVLSGLRKGELEALRWLDIESRAVIVDEAVHRNRLGIPKTPKSTRTVAIGPMVEQALAAWRKQARFTEDDDFMFAIKTNTPIDLKNAVDRHVKPACKRLGLPAVSWHDFRRTYTTWGRMAGVKAETMRDQLGHTSVVMTLDVYSKVEDRSREAALIEEYAFPKPLGRVS